MNLLNKLLGKQLKFFKSETNSSVYPVTLQPISRISRFIFQFLHYAFRHNITQNTIGETIKYTQLDTQI